MTEEKHQERMARLRAKLETTMANVEDQDAALDAAILLGVMDRHEGATSELVHIVASWAARAVKLWEATNGAVAEIHIRLTDLGYEDDDCPWPTFEVDERATIADIGGRMPRAMREEIQK